MRGSRFYIARFRVLDFGLEGFEPRRRRFPDEIRHDPICSDPCKDGHIQHLGHAGLGHEPHGFGCRKFGVWGQASTIHPKPLLVLKRRSTLH